jgi:hypothetical protein
MQSALDEFRISINRVRELVGLHNSIKAQPTNVQDVSDILRSALVLAVSALDYYIHEVVTLGMLEIHRGQRLEPPVSRNSSQSAFARFQVSLGSARQDRIIATDIASWLESEIENIHGSEFVRQPHLISSLTSAISHSLLNKLNSASWLEDEIRERLSYQSFQQPDKIADAIRLISDKKLWDEVSVLMGKGSKEIKQKLTLIVDRRNQIAREADVYRSWSIGNRWPIDESYVEEAVDFIEQVVESIHQIL